MIWFSRCRGQASVAPRGSLAVVVDKGTVDALHEVSEKAEGSIAGSWFYSLSRLVLPYVGLVLSVQILRSCSLPTLGVQLVFYGVLSDGRSTW